VATDIRWRAAILNGAAVLVGILVAFGVDAAWDSRQERVAASAYLTSLSTELTENRGEFGNWIGILEESMERANNFLKDLVVDGSSDVTGDSIRAMMWGLAPLVVVPPRRAAFDDLVTGGLQTIPDAGVRRLILRYGQSLEMVRAMEEAGAAWHLARFTAYEEAESDFVGMRSSVGGFAGRSDIRFEFDREAFVGNRVFANILGHYISRENFIIEARRELLATLDALQEAIQ
jgi:hypothetical protein